MHPGLHPYKEGNAVAVNAVVARGCGDGDDHDGGDHDNRCPTVSSRATCTKTVNPAVVAAAGRVQHRRGQVHYDLRGGSHHSQPCHRLRC